MPHQENQASLELCTMELAAEERGTKYRLVSAPPDWNAVFALGDDGPQPCLEAPFDRCQVCDELCEAPQFESGWAGLPAGQYRPLQLTEAMSGLLVIHHSEKMACSPPDTGREPSEAVRTRRKWRRSLRGTYQRDHATVRRVRRSA